MGKFLLFLILIAIVYVAIGILFELVFIRADKMFKLDEESIIRIITWPKRLKYI